MLANELLSSLQKKEYKPLYFLQGEEPFYIDQVAAYIEENVLNEAEKGFNLTIMYGKDSSMEQVLANARRFPMMAERQVVIVKEAQALADFKNEAGRDMLEAYCQIPVPTTLLVFCHKYGKLNGTTKLAKALKKHAVLLTTEVIRDYKLPAWINDYLQTIGLTATEKAIQLLADHIGNNLEKLTNEIDKLRINLPKGAVIDDQAVHTYVGINKDYNVFELQNAIATRNPLKANQIMKYYGANPKEHHPIPTIAFLYGMFAKILKTHAAPDKSQAGLARHLKVAPFVVKEYVKAAQNYPLGKVLQNMAVLQRADLTVKGVESAPVKEAEILIQLVFELLH